MEREDRDVSFLPSDIRKRSTPRGDGAEWHRDDAPAAVDALADAGKVVVRLFLRRRDATGDVDWELPWDEIDVGHDRADPRTAIEEGRRTALAALTRDDYLEEVAGGWADWILIWWCDVEAFPRYVGVRRGAYARMNAIDDRLAKRVAQPIFEAHGYTRPIRVVPRQGTPLDGDDERVFLVAADALAPLPRDALVTELQERLRRKVRIVPDDDVRGEHAPLR